MIMVDTVEIREAHIEFNNKIIMTLTLCNTLYIEITEVPQNYYERFPISMNVLKQQLQEANLLGLGMYPSFFTPITLVFTNKNIANRQRYHITSFNSMYEVLNNIFNLIKRDSLHEQRQNGSV